MAAGKVFSLFPACLLVKRRHAPRFLSPVVAALHVKLQFQHKLIHSRRITVRITQVDGLSFGRLYIWNRGCVSVSLLPGHCHCNPAEILLKVQYLLTSVPWAICVYIVPGLLTPTWIYLHSPVPQITPLPHRKWMYCWSALHSAFT